MALYTFSDLKALVGKYARRTGSDVECGDPVAALANKAHSRLCQRRESSEYRERVIRAWTDNGMIALPRGVEMVIQCNVDGQPRKAFDRAYEFTEFGPGEIGAEGGGSYVDLQLEGRHFPTFYDPPDASAVHLLAFCSDERDLGAAITIHGYGTHNEFVVDQVGIGESIACQIFRENQRGAIDSNNLIKSTKQYHTITAVQKARTHGFISLIGHRTVENGGNPDSHGDWYNLARYRPDETKPVYARYRVLNHDCANGHCLLLHCRLGHEDYIFDSDALIIQNMHALEFMAQACVLQDAEQINESLNYEVMAIQQLTNHNASVRQKDAINQTSIRTTFRMRRGIV